MDKIKIGTKIKEAIENEGFSYIQIGEKLNVSENTIGNWVRGKSTPDLIQLNQLAIFCHKKLGWFLGEDAEENKITGVITLPIDFYNELIGAKAQNDLLEKQLTEAHEKIIDLSLLAKQAHTDTPDKPENTNNITGGTSECGNMQRHLKVKPHSG